MPRIPAENNQVGFVTGKALATAKDVIEQSEHRALTERASLQVLDLLENPPKPNKRMMAAAFAMPKCK